MQKSKDVYVAYRKAGYSKQFFEAHREEILLHKAAKEAFGQLEGGVPKLKDLNHEYAELLQKRRMPMLSTGALRKKIKNYRWLSITWRDS